jgi:hypothetical protein
MGTHTRVTSLQYQVPRSVVPEGQGFTKTYCVPEGRPLETQKSTPLEH